MSLSISCTEVVVARCSTELMLLAAISLSLSGWRSRLVTTSRRTNSRISASTSVPADWSCSTLLYVLRSMFDPPFSAPRGRTSTSEAAGEHEKGDLLAAKSGKFLGLILPPVGTEKRQVSLSSQGQRPHPPRSGVAARA